MDTNINLIEEKANYYAIIPANVRYDKELNPNAKLLYAEITSLCNLEGYCWANNSYFSKLYGVDERTIRRWIETLVKKGYISVEMIEKDGTKSIEKRLIFITEKVRTKMSIGTDKNVLGGTDKNVLHNNKYINNKKIYKKRIEMNQMISIWFEKFWNEYPRKIAKKKAKEKFVKICLDEETFKKIMNSLRYQKQNEFSKDVQYIPHASTWLNQERYEDTYTKPIEHNSSLDIGQKIYDPMTGEEIVINAEN